MVGQYWDLEGVVEDTFYERFISIQDNDVSDKLSFVIYYLIGNYFYKSEYYARIKAMDMTFDYYEFTTCDEVYRLTGISGFSFSIREQIPDEMDYMLHYKDEYNLINFLNPVSSYNYIDIYDSFNIYKITNLVIYGNTDILYHYFRSPFTNAINFYLLESTNKLINKGENICSWDDLLMSNINFMDLSNIVNFGYFSTDVTYDNLNKLLVKLNEVSEYNEDNYPSVKIKDFFPFFSSPDFELLNTVMQYFNAVYIVYDCDFLDYDLDMETFELFIIWISSKKRILIDDRVFSLSLTHLRHRYLFFKYGIKVKMS